MSITVWIILGLATGLVAGRLALRSRTGAPPALLAVIGMAGALTGGWAASSLLSRPFADGSLSPATWPAAVAGAVVLLAACRRLTGRPRQPGRQAVTVPVRRVREPR